MSYILDALRRADAERERGAVPSIHAQQYSQLPGDDEPRKGPRALLWVVGGLTVALLAALAWNFVGRDAARPPMPQPIAIAPTLPAPTAPVAASAIGANPASAAAPPASEATRPARKPVRKLPPPGNPAGTDLAPGGAFGVPSRSGSGGPALGGGLPPGAPGGPAAGAQTAIPPALRATPGTGADTRVYAQRDLPEEIRRSLPNIAVSGSTYSNDRASRMLMINGQIFREGDAVAAGLVLQQIKPRAAVLAFKGYRYEIGF